jgi:hypothetical protein
VHDRVDTTRKRALEHGPICDVALDEIDGWVGVGIEVDDPDVGAMARELRYDLAPDEARAARDEYAATAKVATVCVAHFIGVSARAVAGSSLEVACQLTVGMIA